MRLRQEGLTLIELLISVALSMSMTLVFIQLHVQSHFVSARQQSVSRQLENIATLQHLLSHSLRDALYTISIPDINASSSTDSASMTFSNTCAGIVVQGQCMAPVTSWVAGDSGWPHISGAVTGSSVLQIRQSCCPGVVADQFYLAHRGGLQSNPISLYRRRLQSNGGYAASVELVEGVSELSVSFIMQDNLTGGLALVNGEQVPEWWGLKAVRVRYRLQNMTGVAGENQDALSYSFTLASRQVQQTGDGVGVQVYAAH